MRYKGDEGEVTDVTSDGELSLSDTTSLASLEEYEDPNVSDLTPAREPLNGYQELSTYKIVTLSSRDTGSIPRSVPALRIVLNKSRLLVSFII